MRHCILLSLLLLACSVPTANAWEINFTIGSSGSLEFTPTQVGLLNDAIVRTKGLWETTIAGYQPGINIPSINVAVLPNTSGLASATITSQTSQGGYTLATGGVIRFNVDQMAAFADWQGPGANGLNFIDDIFAHEAGHILGIGSLWTANGVYVPGSFQYTGQHGLAAYQAEFDAAATFIPVENAGAAGTIGMHWDQIMRSSVQEGNPSDPWGLDPRLGIVDGQGRDFGLELMSGAIDPDWGEPFLSRTSVESLRDLGFVVNAFEDFNGDGAVDLLDLAILEANLGASGLGIDSVRLGDANRDRVVDNADFLLWQAAAVPEPRGAFLLLLGMAIAGAGLLKCRCRDRAFTFSK